MAYVVFLALVKISLVHADEHIYCFDVNLIIVSIITYVHFIYTVIVHPRGLYT